MVGTCRRRGRRGCARPRTRRPRRPSAPPRRCRRRPRRAARPRCPPRAPPGRRRAGAGPPRSISPTGNVAGRVGDHPVLGDADVEGDDVALPRAVGARDAVDDHLVRGDAGRGREALVALRGRDAAARVRCSSSAIRSSSAIEMPGSSRSSSSASVSATTAPAAAISSISRALLRMITRRPPVSPERVLHLGVDLGDRPLAVQRDQLAERAVVLDDRLGLLVVDAEPLGDHVRRVVGAVLLGRAHEHPLRRHLVAQVEEEDGIELPADLGERLVERLGLGEVAREAVEHEAGVARRHARAARGSARS